MTSRAAAHARLRTSRPAAGLCHFTAISSLAHRFKAARSSPPPFVSAFKWRSDMPHEQPQTQSTNIHHLRVGDFVVTTIQDAYLQGGFGLISNLDEATVQDLHAASRRATRGRVGGGHRPPL